MRDLNRRLPVPLLAFGLGLLIGRGLVALVSRTINHLYFVVAVNELALPASTVAKALLAGLGTALVAALLWPTSTVLVDFLYLRLLSIDDPLAFLDRFAFWSGAPYPLLVVGLFAFPIVAGAMLARR